MNRHEIASPLPAVMAQSTIKGRQAGAGTGDHEDLTALQVRTILAVGGGPIHPHSAYPVTAGMVYFGLYTGAGSTWKHEEMCFVADATTVTADATWRLAFAMPPVLPVGTPKLWIISRANAITNSLKVNPKWTCMGFVNDPSSATLNAEGTTTITWGASQNDRFKETKITLDADTVVAGQILIMDVVFEDSGMTLAVQSGHHFMVIWE